MHTVAKKVANRVVGTLICVTTDTVDHSPRKSRVKSSMTTNTGTQLQAELAVDGAEALDVDDTEDVSISRVVFHYLTHLTASSYNPGCIKHQVITCLVATFVHEHRIDFIDRNLMKKSASSVVKVARYFVAMGVRTHIISIVWTHH